MRASGDKRDAREAPVETCFRLRAGLQGGRECVAPYVPIGAVNRKARWWLLWWAEQKRAQRRVSAICPKPYGVLAEIELVPSCADWSSCGNAAMVPSCPQGR